MLLKCKICGGDLEIKEESNITICEYCGTEQALPKINDENKKRQYERATHYRKNNEYDKAIAIYENIINEEPTDCEIYWQLLLCEYGVEYVKDKKTDKYIPTCNRTKTTSIFTDINYKNAIKYANNEQKIIYEKEAQEIDKIQKNAIEIANKEEPFDIFICYKETDEEGKRTIDSVFAQDIYLNLTNQGYKVFFAKITLENKLGTEYEPYIFSALNSAKIMIVVGTKKDYINSVWVKNEWSRFLNLAKEDKGKLLIPAYKEMDPYDLPEEFAHLQAIDLGKIGAITDLTNKIETTVNSKIKNNKKSKPKNKENIKKQKKLIKFTIIISVIIMFIIIGIIILNNIIMPETQYKKAEKLMNESKYDEAIEIYEKLNNYKDSNSKVVTCVIKKEEKMSEELSKYIGLYDKTEKMTNFTGDEVEVGYSLEIKKASSSKIEFTLSNVGLMRIADISETARLKEDTYEFTFEDSWLNKGKGTLQLLEDGITINLKTEEFDEHAMFGIGDGKLEFKFKDMKK